jgi:glycogen(starch) synthase
MHVLVTADTIGGVWTYVRELVTGLVKSGVQVTLVSFGEIPASRQTAWMDRLPGLDFRPTGFRLEWMQDAERDIEVSSEYLASIVREVRPDILHLNQYCYGGLEVDVPRIIVAHSDVLSWWVAVHGEEPKESQWIAWYRRTVARGLAGAQAVVAPSHWMLSALSSHYGRPLRASVIYNGRTPHLFNPHITKEDYVVSVGRLWDGGKQVSLLKNIDPPFPVYIAGSEDHPESTSCAYKRRGHRQKNLYFKGAQGEAQLRHLYSRASVYVATSRYEPFGLAPVEAALSRCAILANDIASFREIWGDDALYFRTNDATDLQSALQLLASDKALRGELANRAYEHARRHYTAQVMVNNYMALYRSLVAAEATAA